MQQNDKRGGTQIAKRYSGCCNRRRWLYRWPFGRQVSQPRETCPRHGCKAADWWYQRFDDVENLALDLNIKENCEIAAKGMNEIYNLAANMGGMGFIEHNKALCMLSVLINTHMLQAARPSRVPEVFYSSSACVYNADKQKDFRSAFPEGRRRLSRHARRRLRLGKTFLANGCAATSVRILACYTRVARFHNVYGPGEPGSAAARKPPRQFAGK